VGQGQVFRIGLPDRQQRQRSRVIGQVVRLFERNVERLAADIVFFFRHARADHVLDAQRDLLGMGVAREYQVPAFRHGKAGIVARQDDGNAAGPGGGAELFVEVWPFGLRSFVDQDGFDAEIRNGGVGGVGRMRRDGP